MRSLVLVFFFLFNLAYAEAVQPAVPTTVHPAVHPAVMIGSGVMFEKGNDAVSENTRLPLSLGAGVRLDQWAARFEYGSFHTTDGNATISTSRDLETALAWGSFEFGRDASWTPYVGVGLGMSRTSSETRLAQSFESAKGNWAGMFAIAVGFRGEWTPHLFVRPELRYESAEAFKTKDARMGAFVQLDLVF